MCKNRSATLVTQRQQRSTRTLPSSTAAASPSSSTHNPAASYTTATATSTSIGTTATAATTASSSSSSGTASSLSSLRISLPDNPIIYSFREIATATNNFLSNRITPSSSSTYRCSLHGRDTVVVHRPFRGDPASLPARLAAACKSHHRSLVRLLGVSISSDRIYLVYDFAAGLSLADCLRSLRNPSFTPLSTWISRIQIAADLAQGLEYIHHHSIDGGTVHNRIKSSGIIISESDLSAKICHFGAAFLVGELPDREEHNDKKYNLNKMSRSDSGSMKIEGTRGYLAPELIAGGSVSRMSDVFAFGVVILELISGQDPVKYSFDRVQKEYRSVSVVETARQVLKAEGSADEEEAERRKRVRQWVDRRLRDSFPVEVVEKLMVVATRCVEEEATRRPNMTTVAGKISKLLLESKVWAERVKAPVDISVSLAPR
ncbi:hypothetical protein HPP92_007167 [Vanilla planifolia]|uniref:Protein kinase domain-containing protein n=1 Tax=Vanilla planifolia TaxID=51239 RepID=A0A835RFU9_VANPL|nr:hypothetical protein HPP92_007167 [Vanilla planifolia]